MRMRKIKNLPPRMDAAGGVLFESGERSGLRAADIFGEDKPLYIEIGCGKGRFICRQAAQNPQNGYLGIERVKDVLVLAMEQAVETGVSNLRFMAVDAGTLRELFAPGCADGIYLNFSDPWPKSRHEKRRLNSPGFLELYRYLLKDGAPLELKTDNRGFFLYGVDCLRACKAEILDITDDLHSENRPENVVTEYEQRWSEQGIKINYLKARF